MEKHWTSIVWLSLMLPFLSVKGQVSDSMIHNPSFEIHTYCPQKVDALGVMNEVEGWWQPSRGSSDYFHACGTRECQTPRNKMGVQRAHSGEGYCGIYCSQENYREYLQTELREPLAAGRRYRVSFWTSLADKSPHAIATLSALLTRERIGDTTWEVLMQRELLQRNTTITESVRTYYRPQVSNPADKVLDNTTEWVEISGEFTAEGGEKFLTIGNFNSFNRSNVVATGKDYSVLPGAYYYIDDVSLICLDSLPPKQLPTTEEPREGDLVSIDGIYFATGQSELLQQSFRQLSRLKELLEAHPNMRIELRGHTDDQGTVDFNQRLSEARAKAVADYLVSHGIQASRIEWNGYGKSQPVDSNDTEEGRQRNRRVEYRVLKK